MKLLVAYPLKLCCAIQIKHYRMHWISASPDDLEMIYNVYVDSFMQCSANDLSTRQIVKRGSQRRQSGLKSGGSWIRVNKISIFPGQLPRNFDFFRQFHHKI